MKAKGEGTNLERSFLLGPFSPEISLRDSLSHVGLWGLIRGIGA